MSSKTVLSLDLYSGSLSSVVDRIEWLIDHNQSAYICAANTHMSVLAHENGEFAEIVNNADFVVPDGRPLFWLLRLLGERDATQIRGGDLFDAICETANKSDIKLGFYGGSDAGVLDAMRMNLSSLYPNANLVYFNSPPFRELDLSELDAVRMEIVTSEVDVLFVGIGCPKQERWMAANSSQVKCTMIGVGAVFDFVAGTKSHAPKLIQTMGLEWLFRLCSEPKRLWRRYLVGNTKFVVYVLHWLVSGKSK